MKTTIKIDIKQLVLGIAVLGLAIGTSAFTTSMRTLAENEVMFGRTQNGTWVELETSAEQNAPCKEDNMVCKAIYLEGFSPITGTEADPGHVETISDEGYVDLP